LVGRLSFRIGLCSGITYLTKKSGRHKERKKTHFSPGFESPWLKNGNKSNLKKAKNLTKCQDFAEKQKT
jgi:hypothetical protein